METIKLNQPKLLVVEGKDACRFFIKLLQHLKISDVQVIDFGGNDDLRKKLIALPNIPGFDMIVKLAIIRDAENGQPQDALNSISDALKKNKITCPDKLNTFEKDNNRYIGIYVLPDNNGQGMLEDLCLSSFTDQPEMECIHNFIKCAKPQHDRISKSKMLCYFAVKDPKANTIAIAAQKSIFDMNKECFKDIKNFLLKFN